MNISLDTVFLRGYQVRNVLRIAPKNIRPSIGLYVENVINIIFARNTSTILPVLVLSNALNRSKSLFLRHSGFSSNILDSPVYGIFLMDAHDS